MKLRPLSSILISKKFNDSFSFIEDDESKDPTWTPEFVGPNDVNNNNATKERKFIVFESCIEKLIQNCRNCGQDLACLKSVKDSFLSVSGHCVNCNDVFEWESQPQFGTLLVGNLIIAAAILFAGCNVRKILRLFQHASIQTFSERTFNNLQTLYLIPTITSVYRFKQNQLFREIKESGHPLRVGGDAWCCYPGYTAKYGSYSVMDLTRLKILDIQLVQELEGLKRCLAFLMEEGLKLSNCHIW
ncbi:hypothetical protein KUTeg_012495 [Tegillarca granosa]|uniref:Uncharacterized protein n=1 Tax=Tegillarca granosa TaxID=220873 RepID=A0ABQ9F384_TEGGR|nr:hypothetical protein KUTeg_012495 [Tegillarca granosa]